MTTVHSLGAKLLCEFVGTFFLVAVGVAAIMHGQSDLLAVALAHGLVIAVMVSAVGHVSGGHFNPAVSITMFVFRQMTLTGALAYTATQLVAGALGAWVAAVGLDIKLDDLAGATPTLSDTLGSGQGLLLEVVATFMLVWVIFAVAVDRDGSFFKIAGLPIGLTITAGILMIGPATGAGLNPARWFGSAVLAGHWDDAWIYVVGPVVGGVLAGAAYLYGVKPRLAGAAAAPDTV